jgi:hypothetical protein
MTAVAMPTEVQALKAAATAAFDERGKLEEALSRLDGARASLRRAGGA